MEDDRRSSAFNMSEADRHYVDASHIWKTKVPPFRILVHSPSKRASTISGGYTVYNVTSLFSQINAEAELDPGLPPRSPTRITVQRRYSHFVLLHTALTRRLPGIALPPLPEKQYAGRFSEDFVEARRGDLERYLSRVIRHPVARYAEVVTFFLSCESESVSEILGSVFKENPAKCQAGMEAAHIASFVNTTCGACFLCSCSASGVQRGLGRGRGNRNPVHIAHTRRWERSTRT